MEVNSKEICNILGFRVTEYNLLEDGKVVDTFFRILDKTGQPTSRNFNHMGEAIKILFDIEKAIYSDRPTQ